MNSDGNAATAQKKPVVFKPEHGGIDNETTATVERGEVLNASGHQDKLKRQYGLLRLVALSLTVDSAWLALGSSISVSICETAP